MTSPSCGGTLLDDLRRALDLGLSVPARLGLHPWELALVRIREEAIRPGVFTSRSTDVIPLTVADGYQPRWRLVSTREVFLSPNLLRDADYALSLVRSYSSGCGVGGFDPSLLLPDATDGYQTQIFIRAVGPGTPESGAFYKIISVEHESNLSLTIYARNTQEAPQL